MTHCNSCGEPFVPSKEKVPYVTLVRSDGTGTLFHWTCVYIVDRTVGKDGLHPRYLLEKVAQA